MKSILFSFFLLLTVSGYSQVLSKINIIYEYRDTLVMNDGTKYKIIEKTPLYAVTDTTIQLKYTVNDKTLILNRVLLVEEKEKEKNQMELIEWVKGKMVFYQLRESKNSE